MKKNSVLNKLIKADETLVMPNAYDPISAKIIEYVGFKAVQCSGYGFSVSKCYSKEADITLEENLAITKSIVDSVSIPVMADGEDGYGDNEEFLKNIKAFICTGIEGMNIEDQNLRGKCLESRIIPETQMIEKIKLAIQLKKELDCSGFVINARTDALLLEDRNEALKVAIDRANSYLEYGADLCFVPYVRELDEVKLLAKEIKGPLSIAIGMPYNIGNISINQCRELGIARVSLPTFTINSSIKALLDSLMSIKESGEFLEVMKREALFSDMNILNNKLLKKSE